MKKLIIIVLIVLAVAALLALLYKVFVLDMVMDRGDTLNHDPVDKPKPSKPDKPSDIDEPVSTEPRVIWPEDDAELIAVRYSRGGDTYSIEVDGKWAILICSATIDGKRVERENAPIDIADVRALDTELRAMELLEYPANERGPEGESTDLTIHLAWSDGTEGEPPMVESALSDFFRKILAESPSGFKAGALIFDYYEGGSGSSPGYEEYTLTATEDADTVLLDFYERPSGDDETETRTSYLVPFEVYEKAMELVNKHGMADWKPGPGLDGKIYVCKFYRDGRLLRVTSEDVPEKGRDAFDDVRALLDKSAEPDKRIDPPD